MTRGIQRAFDAEQTHPKVSLKILTSQPYFTAGSEVSGVVQLECTSEKVFLGDIWLECYGAEELQSLDHTAANVFHRAHTPFQAPHLPSSSAVDAEHMGGPNLYAARRGRTRFRFSMPLPQDLPSSAAFTDAAKLSFHLKAMCQVADASTRVLVTKVAEFKVQEQWKNWHEEQFLNGSRKEASEAYAGGTVTLEASVPRVLWCEGEEAQVGLYIRNTTSKAINQVHIALMQKLRVPSSRSESNDLIPGPQIASTLSDQPLDIGLAPKEKRHLEIRVPLPTHTVRGRTLFDINLVLVASIKFSSGFFGSSKDMQVEVPLAVAAPCSLPQEALEVLRPQQRYLKSPAPQDWSAPASPRLASFMSDTQAQLPLPPPMAAHSPFPSPHASPILHPAASPRVVHSALPITPALSPGPMSLPSPIGSPIAGPSTSPMLHQAHWHSPPQHMSPIASPVIPFTPPPKEDPFFVGIDPTASLLTPSRFMTSLGMAPATTRPARSSSDPALITRYRSPMGRPPLPPLPVRPPSSASTTSSHPASLTPGSPRTSEPDLSPLHLNTQEEAVVRHNLEPQPSYSAMKRVKSQRRHSAPTPPLAASAVIEVELPRSDALEAIGEDGESQAGSRFTIRSSQIESVADNEPSIVSTAAVRPSGLPGASSAAMLEDLVEREGFLEQEGLQLNKTLPKSPPSAEVTQQSTHQETPRLSARNIFAGTAKASSPPPARVSASPEPILTEPPCSEPEEDPAPRRKPLPTPTIKSEEGLMALERRLTRSPTVIMADLDRRVNRPVATSQSSKRSSGALRAKSSQISLTETLVACDPPQRPRPRSAASLPAPPSSKQEEGSVAAWLQHSACAPQRNQPSPDPPRTISPRVAPDLTWEDSVSNFKPRTQIVSKPSASSTMQHTSARPASIVRRESRLAAPTPATCSTPPLHEMRRPIAKRSSLVQSSPQSQVQTSEALSLNQPPARLHPSGRPSSVPEPAEEEQSSKHNHKSARGGRGGQVTSVAQLWQQISKDPKGEASELPRDIPTALNLDPQKTSAPLRPTSPGSSSGRRVDLRSLHALMSADSETVTPSPRSSRSDKRRSLGDSMPASSNNKCSAAPAFLNTSFNNEKVRMAPPSVLQPLTQQPQPNFRASTGSAVGSNGPARFKLQALIAKYDQHQQE